MTEYSIVLRFRGGYLGSVKIDRTILVRADNSGEAFEAAERYITERSDYPALRIVVNPLRSLR